MKKIWCLLILCSGLFAGELSGAIRVTRARIVLGNSFRIAAGSMATFEFAVENTDPVPCRVMIRIRQSEAYLPSGNNNSPEVYVPAKSSVVYSVPVHLDNTEKYNYEVFVNGVKQSSSLQQNCLVKMTSPQDFCMGILNDNSELTDGLFFRTASSRSALYNIRANNAPTRKELYGSLKVLVIARPDFSAMTSEQFSAILEYVSSGGTVIFADPEGILEAARTPLNVLLPVEGSALYKVHDLRLFGFFPDAAVKALPREGVDLLYGVVKPGRNVTSVLTMNGLPVLCEMRFGLGTSRMLAFSLSSRNFINSPRFLEKVRNELCFVPPAESVHNDFSSALNMLTGFAVPETSLIRNILFVYFLVLVLILFWGFRKKRTSTAWALCAVFAVCSTLLILLYARITIGKRGSLAAVVRLENASFPAETSDLYMALYSRKAVSTPIASARTGRNIFSVIPYHRTLGVLKRDASAPVLDLHYNASDAMEIRSLHLPVRASRQILDRRSPGVLPLRKGYEAPVLMLDQDGIRLKNWKIPGKEKVESAFMLFPGGSSLVNVDSERNCTLEDSREYMTDPLLRELRTALEKSYAKKHPVLVTVSHLNQQNSAESPAGKDFILQGKRLRMYASDLCVDGNASSVRIPGKLLMKARNDQSGRMLFSGNRLRSDNEFQEGHEVSIRWFLPSSLTSFRIRSAELELILSKSENVEIMPVLVSDNGTVLQCEKLQDDRYRFFLKKGVVPRPGKVRSFLLTLQSRSKLTRRNHSVDVKIGRWSILDLNLDLKGTIPSPDGMEKK